MKKTLLFVILATIGLARCAQQPTQTAASTTQEPTIVVDESKIISLSFDDDRLRAAKAAIEANDPAIMTVYNQFKNYVEANYLNMKPVSIVEGKTATAPSRDPRDYISQSPYWWPDPENPGGPYIRQDGVVNPEVLNYPERTLGYAMGDGTQSLALMYYFTGDEKYAEKATALIRHFFLSPVTGMNPNVTFSQYVPGMDRIRGTGVLEAGRTFGGLNAAKIMKYAGAKAWTDKDEAELQDWAKCLAYWFENSTTGQAESRSVNNHGTSYEANHETLLLYIKDYDHLRKVILEEQVPRFPIVVTEDSVSLHELARTKGIGYCTALISGAYRTAIMAEKIGITDVWSHVGDNGRGIMMSVDYMIRYWKDPSIWPFMQIIPYEGSGAAVMLTHVAKMMNDTKYLDDAKEIGISGRPNFARVRTINDVLYHDLIK